MYVEIETGVLSKYLSCNKSFSFKTVSRIGGCVYIFTWQLHRSHYVSGSEKYEDVIMTKQLCGVLEASFVCLHIPPIPYTTHTGWMGKGTKDEHMSTQRTTYKAWSLN